jgi:hypothetical protein
LDSDNPKFSLIHLSHQYCTEYIFSGADDINSLPVEHTNIRVYRKDLDRRVISHQGIFRGVMRQLVLASLIILILPAMATDAVIDGNNWFGCTSQSDYRLLCHYQQERDFKAFNQTLADGIQHMRATKWKNNEAVYIEDREGDLVLLSRPGNSRAFWTDIKAIRKLWPIILS